MNRDPATVRSHRFPWFAMPTVSERISANCWAQPLSVLDGWRGFRRHLHYDESGELQILVEAEPPELPLAFMFSDITS